MMRRPAIAAWAAICFAGVSACGENATDPGDPGDTGNPNLPQDVTPPTVQISVPTDNAQVPIASTVTVGGTASDNDAIKSVSITVGGTEFVASGTTNWSFDLQILAPGPSTVTVVAEDVSGNKSTPASVSFTILPGWLTLGGSEPGVSEVALASDGSNLYRFYCAPVENRDEGRLDRWNGMSWVVVANPTNQCHAPDIEVEGSLWVASFADDSPDYGFASNANGPSVVLKGTLLVDQWGMDVAIAQGRPYMAFAARYSDGNPFSYMMLHVISPFPPGNRVLLNGGWGRNVFQDISTDPAIAGDATGWYAVSRQGSNLYVMKASHDGTSSVRQEIGPGFTFVGDPVKPEIIVYQGQPVVAWMENAQTSLHVARWDGANWIPFGQDQVSTGFFGRLRMDVYQNDLYVLDVKSSAAPAMTVSHWDGASWTELPSALGAGQTPSATRGDIAVRSDGLVVAYISGGVLRVKQYLP
jgi:Bacterial Ig domain